MLLELVNVIDLKKPPFIFISRRYGKLVVADNSSSRFLVLSYHSSDSWDAVVVCSDEGVCLKEGSTYIPYIGGVRSDDLPPFGWYGGILFYPSPGFWGFIGIGCFSKDKKHTIPIEKPWVIYANNVLYVSSYFGRNLSSNVSEALFSEEEFSYLFHKLLKAFNFTYENIDIGEFCKTMGIDLENYRNYTIVKSLRGNRCILTGFDKKGRAVVILDNQKIEVPFHMIGHCAKFSLDGRNWGVYGTRGGENWILINGKFYDDMDHIKEDYYTISPWDFGGFSNESQGLVMSSPPFFTPGGTPYFICEINKESYIYLPDGRIHRKELLKYIRSTMQYDLFYLIETHDIEHLSKFTKGKPLPEDPESILDIKANSNFIFVLDRDFNVLIYKIIH